MAEDHSTTTEQPAETAPAVEAVTQPEAAPKPEKTDMQLLREAFFAEQNQKNRAAEVRKALEPILENIGTGRIGKPETALLKLAGV